MAKKGAREFVGIVCSVCKSQNYIKDRNKLNMELKGKGKLTLKKFCNVCRKIQIHKENSKLK